ncbi:MAG: type II toxin-antitoxin system VapC family toxin [Candidatus Aureabacteria bacterium]|nr:type II toxin-antitoxin system VapC family toxin [Candidatus Auribacterota bacterium]
MNLVDSSGWLEYFADAPNANFFEKPLLQIDELIVPTISIYEVFKRILQQRGDDDALQAIAVMQQGKVIDLDMNISLHAAKLSHELKLPMADSIILSTAQLNMATLWTQDSEFEKIDGVKYISKHK